MLLRPYQLSLLQVSLLLCLSFFLHALLQQIELMKAKVFLSVLLVLFLLSLSGQLMFLHPKEKKSHSYLKQIFLLKSPAGSNLGLHYDTLLCF